MSGFISKNTQVSCSGGDLIMVINDEANKQKAEGKDIINASIGMLFDEDGKLASFPVVDDYLKNNINENSKKYDSITGTKAFKDSLKNWLFKDVDFKGANFSAVGTMGATGALALINKCYVNNNEAIIVPSIRWGNYDSIAYENENKLMIYNLFKDNRFDIESLKETVDESCSLYNKAVIIINDPCQNPTGYSLSDEEWDEVLSYLKEKSKNYPLVLVDDIAYVNFKKEAYTSVLQKFVDACNDNLLITICFSSSKTLQIYGLRGGGLIALSSNDTIKKEFENVAKTYCRATWSSPNHLATNAMCDVFGKDEYRSLLLKDLETFKAMLQKRGEEFVKEAKEVSLPHYPYSGGFFILVKCDNNVEVARKLREKGVFVVPMCGGLRVSIASITNEQIKGFATEIKKNS